MLYLETTEGFVLWSGQVTADSVVHARDIETNPDWDDAKRAAIGLFAPVDAGVPAGKRAVSQSVQRVNGIVSVVYVLEDIPALTPTDIQLTRRQVRRAIANTVGLEAVESAIAALPAGPDRDNARVDWDDSPVYVRTHPLFNALASAVGVSPAEIDTIWIWAADFDA